jgi:hypothetical protein
MLKFELRNLGQKSATLTSYAIPPLCKGQLFILPKTTHCFLIFSFTDF